MLTKCILLRRLDLYTAAWSKHSQDLEKEEPEEDDTMSVGEALKSLSIGVNSLKQASLIMNQVNFFIRYLNSELKQLNLLETKHGNDQKQPDGNGRSQSSQNVVRPRYQSFGNVQQSGSNSQQTYHGLQNSQQKVAQNFQQGNQQGNQQKTVKIFLFPCPLGCQHSVPWGSLSGCENFKAMAPQMRKLNSLSSLSEKNKTSQRLIS